MSKLKAPFPYFGGKSRVAPVVWQAFGKVRNYIEPFFGSGAVLLNRPQPFDGVETINDADGYVVNFWRSIQHDPEATAQWADNPVFECDLHSRHVWLKGHRTELVERLEGDPDFYDPKIAGWWVWGICTWIGGGFCSSVGPWSVVDGRLVKDGRGVKRKIPYLGDAGRGVNMGSVKRKIPPLSHTGTGVNSIRADDITGWFCGLSNRFNKVRIVCGDWGRIMGDSVTYHPGKPTGVFLDPPYSAEAGRDNELYTTENLTVAHEVREWAIANGDNPNLRIALCGYEGEHEMPVNWVKYAWGTNGGYAGTGFGRGKENSKRERIWFSPHCKPLAKDIIIQAEITT